MRKNVINILLAVVLTFIVAVPVAMAEVVDIDQSGVKTYGRTHIFEDGNYIGEHKTYTFYMSVGDSRFEAFCADIDETLEFWASYEADLQFMDGVSPWCEIAYLLENNEATDDHSGSVMQLAIWKLLEPGRNLYTDDVDTEAEANALVDAASGMCPLLCMDDTVMDLETSEDGTVTVSLTQGGQPVVGEEVTVSFEGQTSTGLTDANGMLMMVNDLSGVELPAEVTATAFGMPLSYFGIADGVQDVLSNKFGNACTVEGSGFYEEEIGSECGPCEGKLTELTLLNNGDGVDVQVYEGKKKKCRKQVFDGFVASGETFTFDGNDAGSDDTLSNKITIYVNGRKYVRKALPTSCRKKNHLEIGSVIRDFEVVAGVSSEGGPLCDPAQGGGELCMDGCKPKDLQFRYTGEDCSASSHDQPACKAVCEDFDQLDNSVYIIVYERCKVYFEGFVDVGATFWALADNADKTKFGANTEVAIFDSNGVFFQQYLTLHTSCSKPLSVGDQFGSLLLTDFRNEDGCGGGGHGHHGNCHGNCHHGNCHGNCHCHGHHGNCHGSHHGNHCNCQCGCD